MKRFLHIGLSSWPNTHSKEMRLVFDTGDWQAEDIAVQHPDLNNEIIRVANAYRPDLCFIQIQDRGISREAIQALKDNNCWILNWCGDIRHTLPPCYFEYAQFGVDLTCFSNMRDVEIMRGCGYESQFLQIGYSTEIYYPDYSIEKDIDIVFMGNTFSHFPLSGLRRDMVNTLKNVYGDRFKSYGNGMHDGNFNGNQKGEADVYRRSKIGINLSHFDSERYTSDRMFRMLGCGCAILSHQFNNMDEDFKLISRWNSINELKQQIDHLLSSPVHLDLLQGISKIESTKYTFKKMGENILSLYNQYNGKH